MQKIELAKIVAANTPDLLSRGVEYRAKMLARDYSLSTLRAWAATFTAETAEEREEARKEMKSSSRQDFTRRTASANRRSAGIRRR